MAKVEWSIPIVLEIEEKKVIKTPSAQETQVKKRKLQINKEFG